MTDTERKDPVRLPDLANINTDAQLNLNWRKTMKFICVLSMSHVIFGIYLHLKKMVLCLYNGNLAGQPIFYLETLIWKNSWDIPGMWHLLSSVSLVLKYSYYQIIGKLDTA